MLRISLATIGVCVFYASASVGAFFCWNGGNIMAMIIISREFAVSAAFNDLNNAYVYT